MGANPVRLAQRARAPGALGRGGGRGDAADLEAMVADTSEAAVWALSDALLGARPRQAALGIAERLIVQGENVTGLIYGLASRLRKACAAAAQLEEGVPPKQVESGLGMHPYAAQAAGRAARADEPRRAARGDDERSPTSRSGAAAAPTTATSWR